MAVFVFSIKSREYRISLIYSRSKHMGRNAPAGEIVRKASTSKQNDIIDDLILANIQKYAGKSPDEISQRIQELNKEWDIERVLSLNMSVLSLIGITSSLIINPYAIILTIILLLFFIWHAFQGWCPPIPVLRYFKVRSRPEIDREKYALKVIRGDFSGPNALHVPKEIFEAVSKI